ncbi:MAG TPA: ABC transporter permease subunit [Chthoniobacterales bacterium]
MGSFLHDRWNVDVVFTWKAVVLAAAVMSFPLLVRVRRVRFEAVGRSLEEVAIIFGAGPLRVWFFVTLPLASRGIAGGIVLAFAAPSASSARRFSSRGNLPGRTTTLSLKIYEAVQLGEEATAWRLVWICVLLSFGAVFLSERLSRAHL